jgi:hypothetical protein
VAEPELQRDCKGRMHSDVAPRSGDGYVYVPTDCTSGTGPHRGHCGLNAEGARRSSIIAGSLLNPTLCALAPLAFAGTSGQRMNFQAYSLAGSCSLVV